MATFLVVLGILLATAGLAATIGGAPFFAFGYDNTLVLSGTIGFCGGLVVVGLGLLLRAVARLGERLETLSLPHPDATTAMPSPAMEPPARRPAPARERVPPVSEAQEPRAFQAPPPAPVQQADPQWPGSDIAAPPDATPSPGPASVVLQPPPARASAGAQVPQPMPLPRSTVAEPPRSVPPPRRADPPPPVDTGPPADAFRAAWEKTWDREWLDREGGAAAPPAPAGPRRPQAAIEHSPPPQPRPAGPRQDVAPASAPAASAPPQVLKAGVIGGMAYTLYADGSIEAELPEGLVRFSSIQALRDHVERAEASLQPGAG